MAEIDPYVVLQVAPGTSHEVLRAAYRRLAHQYHPDSGAAPDAARMVRLNQAYALVGTPHARAKYESGRVGPVVPPAPAAAPPRPAAASAAPPPRADRPAEAPAPAWPGRHSEPVSPPRWADWTGPARRASPAPPPPPPAPSPVREEHSIRPPGRRRDAYRLPASFPVRIMVASGGPLHVVHATAMDISVTGLRVVVASDWIGANTAVTASFEFAGDRYDMPAVVKRSWRAERSRSVQAGLMFERLDKVTAERLRRAIHEAQLQVIRKRRSA